MAKELSLRSSARGVLVPANLAQALALIAKLLPSSPRGRMRGQELRLAHLLDLDDGACVGFLLDFTGQGARVTGTAHGPSAALFTWAMHALAGRLDCELVEDDTVITPAPETHRAAALAYVETYEREVLAARHDAADVDDGNAFLRWLAREEQIALQANAVFEELPMDDPERLYEQLLESEGVDEVFVSERELVRSLERFKARLPRE